MFKKYALLSHPKLSVEVHHLRFDHVLVEQAATLGSIACAGRVHCLGDHHWIIREMVYTDRHTWPEGADGALSSHDGSPFGAFDVHLDEVDGTQPQFPDQVIDGRHGQPQILDGCARQWSHETIRGRVVRIDVHDQFRFAIPHSLGDHHHASSRDLSGEVPAKAR